MASFMYNPSKTVTDMLSKFLEFDPEQLEIGIWSGDLSLKNVNLRKEAIAPLLNNNNNNRSKRKKDDDASVGGGGGGTDGGFRAGDNINDLFGLHGSSKSRNDKSAMRGDFRKEPLAMTLVSGSVGQMRIRIPWKQLVWGQGAVHVDVSDVMIVVTMQSREETEREEQSKKNAEQDCNSNNNDGDCDGTGVGAKPNDSKDKDYGQKNKYNSARDQQQKLSPLFKAYRDAKQRRLREAEKRQLSGLHIASWLETLHRKNTILKEAQRMEQQQQLHATGGGPSSRRKGGSGKRGPHKEGRLDRLLKHATSDLFWRLFAGIKGSINKARIVIVQDGIEVGCILQSMEVVAGTDGITITHIDGGNDAAASTSQHHTASQQSPNTPSGGDGGTLPTDPSSTSNSPHPLQYESAYDDGEHVDKTFKQHGLGIFVRTETTYHHAKKVPPSLRFSTSVGADDYILRPVDLDISFSFFYPYPPERRKKKSTTMEIAPATNKNEEQQRSGQPIVSESEHTTSSAKQRRGKRDKVSVSPLATTATTTPAPSIIPSAPPQPQPFSSSKVPRMSSLGDIIDRNDTSAPTPRMRGPLPRSLSSDGLSQRARSGLRSSTPSTSQASARGALPPQSASSGAAGPRRRPTTRTDHLTDHDQTTPSSSNRSMSRLLRNKLPRISSNTSDGGASNSGHNTQGRFTSSGTINVDNMSIVDSPTVFANTTNILLEPAPRLECRILMDEIKVVFTSRHYELLGYFLSTITRMKNGRPELSIKSVSETEPGLELRRMTMKMTGGTTSGTAATSDLIHDIGSPLASPSATKPTSAMKYGDTGDIVATTPSKKNAPSNTLSGRLLAFVTSAAIVGKQEDAAANMSPVPPSPSWSESYKFDLPARGFKSARQEVVLKWWKYAIGAIEWEVRKRKHTTSAFRDMYISFDWNKQRYRRREYIDLYVQFKLDKHQDRDKNRAYGAGGNWLFEEDWQRNQKDGDERLLAIEDELPLEQILLYRSIARSMRVRGKKEMPQTVLELWGDDAKKKADLAVLLRPPIPSIGTDVTADEVDPQPPNKKTGDSINHMDQRKNQNPDVAKNPIEPALQEDNLLSLIQNKFESTKRLREKGGVLKWFETGALDPSNTTKSYNGKDEEYSVDAVNPEAANFLPSSSPPPPSIRPSLQRNNNTSSVEMDDTAQRSQQQHRKSSSGIRSSGYGDLQAGSYYASGGTKRDSQPGDIKTIKSNRFGKPKNSRLISRGNTLSTSADSTKNYVPDNHLRIFFSFHVKTFDLMVVEEEFFLSMTPDASRRQSASKLFSPNASQNFRMSDAEDSASEDNLSDLSVLTDDQRFFSEEGTTTGVITEEEDDDDVGAKMSSTDFLLFGLPENPLLRLTVSSFQTSAKGVSGGAMQVGLSIGKIQCTGDGASHILSMGPTEATAPVVEVQIDGSLHRYSRTRVSGDSATNEDTNQSSFIHNLSRGPSRAVSVMYMKDGPSRTLKSDFSKIVVSANLAAATKLLAFYGKSEVKQPERLLMKSSRDVARKIMVQKVMRGHPIPFLVNLSSAIRFHGIEVKVPFCFKDENASEASELESSHPGTEGSPPPSAVLGESNHAAVLGSDLIEFYSGRAIDELIHTSGILDGKDFSVASGSLASSFRKSVTMKTLEMLDLAALTGASDSFSSTHFVLTVGGVQCRFKSRESDVMSFTDYPVNVEILLTTNKSSLLNAESPKLQVVAEVSPVHVLLSERRIELFRAAKSALEENKVDAHARLKRNQKPDPPRIEILAQKILQSIDLKCRRIRVELVKESPTREVVLSSLYKEVVMEECLSDFLSTVSCFDLTFPNEEALSSSMQVCIGRLVGIGLTDDEAWECTNAARINFLDDIALMRRAQSDFLVAISRKIEQSSGPRRNEATNEDSLSDDHSGASNSFEFVDMYDEKTHDPSDEVKSASTDESEELSDDDSQKATDIVQTTVNNAVEKTLASFSALLQESSRENAYVGGSAYLVFELPMGISLSYVKLFYDDLLTFLMTSLVVTNKAGIELLTLVPHVHESEGSAGEEQLELSGHSIAFSRFALDKQYGFGKGGLPMSFLASDHGADSDSPATARAQFDDVEIGELEILFSYPIYDEVIREVSKLKGRKQLPSDSGATPRPETLNRHVSPIVEVSSVVVASSVSLLFTSDTLVPFCRLTLENLSFKNAKALESLQLSDSPSWAVAAKSLSLQNLSPEGQFYPDTLTLLSQAGSGDFPFQLRYFQSSDPWTVNSRIEVDFTGFRLFLIRQFIHEILQYFVYDKYGLGKLKKMYSTDVKDAYGNGKPPLLYSVYLYDMSIICPRTSSSGDLVAFEVEEACVAVSYVPETFAMPTETTPFQANPTGSVSGLSRSLLARTGSVMSFSDYEDCESTFSEESVGPVSSHTSNLKRRLTISLEQVQIFTAIAENKKARCLFQSTLFRFFHSIDGRAENRKPVYIKNENVKNSFHAQSAVNVRGGDHRWHEISPTKLSLEILVDYAPHMRLLIANRDGPNAFALDAKLSQLCLLLSVWDSNMQEMPSMFPFGIEQVGQSAAPPQIPEDFPEYGTDMFVSYLENIQATRSEICCIFKKLSLRCTFDAPGFFSVDPACFQYFDDPACPDESKPGLVLTFDDAVVHIVNASLNVRRIAIGASALDLIDERRVPGFRHVLTTIPIEFDVGNLDDQPSSFADLRFGLREELRALATPMAQPVQCTVFMTPGWSMTNFGIQNANAVMHDLSWLWILLGYFKSYYSEAAFGNLGLQSQKWTHKIENVLRRSADIEPTKFSPLPGIKVDFRLWLNQPILCLPSDYANLHAPAVTITSDTGLWYRYKSIGDLSSQEVASTDLNLVFANEYRSPEMYRRRKDGRRSSSRPLVEGLSFGLRYDSNNVCNHKDVSWIMPFSGEIVPSLSVTGQELEVDPVVLPAPKVVTPFRTSHRHLGPKVCDITLIVEVLPLTISTMSNFFAGPADVNDDFAAPVVDKGPPTYSVCAKVGDLRFIVIDPDLGAQLPVAVLSIAMIEMTMTKFALDQITGSLEPGESNPADLQVTMTSHFWAEYFKLGMTRSWEPLLEPFEFLLLFEQSVGRGRGFSVDSDSPFHVNVTGALLQSLNETLNSFSGVVDETFGDRVTSGKACHRSVAMLSPSKNRIGVLVADSLTTCGEHDLDVIHEIPKPLKGDDRVAFSLRNLTGQRIRIHQQSDLLSENAMVKPVMVSYLNQGESMGLTFAATISVVKNLGIVEVPYPGFSNSKSSDHNLGLLQHTIDIQIPGCRWIQGVKVDTFGRKFEALTPRSSHVLSKISQDWRLRNAMMLLTEVGLDNGGRLITVRSMFEIRNCTTHAINLVFNPDPRYRPDLVTRLEEQDEQENENECSDENTLPDKPNSTEISVIKPGETFQLPTLLIESSLELTGSHLGSMWVCPDTSEQNNMSLRNFTQSNGAQMHKLKASFCSRPIQLAKVVNETALIFQAGGGEDIAPDEAKSGVQVSCPTRSFKGDGQAPFCYALEVGRSPVVNFSRDGSTTDAKESSVLGINLLPKVDLARKEKKDKKAKEKIHGPVAYTLSIHAPMVIVNLLPEGGRFELMHAVRKTVVWYADLQPGQHIPVHSIGLDAPLLLLVNLGFCRTPVGEGALVHHGGDAVFQGKENGVGLKSLGKAVTKGTKQIGKTLTNLADSPDKRAQERLAKINTPQFYDWEKRKGNVKEQDKLLDGSLGMDTDNVAVGGKVHSVETVLYSAADVASETTVVDSVGQRLTLRIENVRGGGGQRRVSLFCPFWIVNTTEHSLRYKQDKSKSFGCGTVISPEKDGSMPVDGSNRNYRSRHQMQSYRKVAMNRSTVEDNGINQHFSSTANMQTVFPGTPGALATSTGRCNLTPEQLCSLLEHELPIDQLADLAYMFNFHDEGLGTGSQMLSVQLYDGSSQSNYISEWSRGFGLESVGFSQVVGIPCKEGRLLELSATVSVAPGFLAGYTKIIRFAPRYVVFNRLEEPIRLWQDSSVIRSMNEDRSTISNQVQVGKESRKWRYASEDRHAEGKVNQYESLFGRYTTLNDTGHLDDTNGSQGRQHISEGTTAHRSALYISTVSPSELIPFTLPDSRAERQLRIDFGGAWRLTASFASDFPGEHTLSVSRVTDLRLLHHVATRAAPKYKIILPPPEDVNSGEWDGELGVFFETEWGSQKDRRIVVKGTRRGKYAFNHTDIHVGDELLRIDGVSVLKLTFDEVMKKIKDRLGQIRAYRAREYMENDQPRRGLRRLSLGGNAAILRKGQNEESERNIRPPQLSLTFRTLEERLRKLRLKAGKRAGGNGMASSNQAGETSDALASRPFGQSLSSGCLESFSGDSSTVGNAVNVELKSLHNTMFVILRKEDKEYPLFRVQNRSINHVLFYRQRYCEGHAWNVLLPGETKRYCWEEPMKPKKLTVRVAVKSQEFFKTDFQSSVDQSCSDHESDSMNDGMVVSPLEENKSSRALRLRQTLAYQYIDNEEGGGFGPSVSVKLEEIGFCCFLPVPAKESGSMKKNLKCEVDSDGGTRLLIVSDDTFANHGRGAMSRNLDALRKQITYEEERSAGLNSLRFVLAQPMNPESGMSTGKAAAEAERSIVAEEEAKRIVDDFSEESTISRRHQVVVEVLEAVGLSPMDFIGNCNPYCEIFLKGRSKSRHHIFEKRRNQKKTYYIEKSLDPKWNDQVFVFDVPEHAVQVTRGHSIQVKLRNFRIIGKHPVLGQASVHFASLRNQQELIGWYPLARKLGNTDMTAALLSDLGQGSIKLRVQWIYTVPALIDYFVILSQRRLDSLKQTRDGMEDQLEHAINSEERKRDAHAQLPGGRITKLAKLEKKALAKEVGKRDTHSARKRKETSLNSRIATSKDTLKASRDRYLYALYFQTAESKRIRQQEQGGKVNSFSHDELVHPTTNVSQLSTISEQKLSPSTTMSDTKKKLESIIAMERTKAHASPGYARKNRKSLDDFFSQQRSPGSSKSGKNIRSAPAKIMTASRAIRRGRFETESGNRRLSALDMDAQVVEHMIGSEHGDPWQPSLLQGQAVYDGLLVHAPDMGMSDLMSVSTDVDEEAKRLKLVMKLISLGYLFHEAGEFFHENHLPNHFRRYLFASSTSRINLPRLFVGTLPSIRQFKSWQAASAIFWNQNLDVTVSEESFTVRLKETPAVLEEEVPMMSTSKSILSMKLVVPKTAPRSTIERSKYRVETMHLSRTLFDRTCRRILGCVLNPGGWLTVRPIAALNLPDSYTGMFVKLNYGSEVLVSQTVDAKVSPRWAPPDFSNATRNDRKGAKKRSGSTKGQNLTTSDFDSSGSDLHVHVEPQQTSGSLRLSVVAERLNAKVELGVVYIPLGAAIAACIDAAQDMDPSGDEMLNHVPTYTRWFPLMEPRLAVPVAGDMGLSIRPRESEQVRDNMFQQYFAPCIQISLMWWPDNQGPGELDLETNASTTVRERSRRTESEGPAVLKTPAIESYFNADFNRVSVALIDSQRAVELLNLSLIEIDFRYAVTRTTSRIGLVVGWIQLDHQHDTSREPVVFAPTPTEHIQPTLQFLALKDNLRTKSNIVSYEYIGIALQEMDCTIEESWIFELWEFFMNVTSRQELRARATEGERHIDVVSRSTNMFSILETEKDVSKTLLSTIEAAGEGSVSSRKKKIYIEQLILGLMKVNLSYVKGKKQNFEFSTKKGTKVIRNLEMNDIQNFALVASGMNGGSNSKNDQSEVFARWSQLEYDAHDIAGSGGALNLPGIIAAVFPSVSDAPIRLQGKVIEHVFESPKEIFSSVKNYYVHETLKQVYKIIGSLDFVGNPTILFSSFVSGVRDLVVAPTAAFLKSPTNVKEVGIGVGQGTISLFSHSASGIFGFSARVWATAGQVVATLSMDSEYRQWHRDRIVNEATNLNRTWKRRGVQSIQEIALRPVVDMALGLTMGTTGFVLSPYRGFRKGGARGLMRGVGIGTAGLVTKPIVGVFDAFTHASQTAHDLAKSVNVLERRFQPALRLRLPYVFGPMNILTSFGENAARSVNLMGIFPPKTKFKRRINRGKEVYVHSEVLLMEPGVATFAIVTSIRVLLVKLRRENNNSLVPSFGWEVDLSGNALVSSKVSDHGHNGVALTITKETRSTQKGGDAELAPSSKQVQKERERQKVTENTQRSNLSSALSVDSANSDRREETDDLGEELNLTRDLKSLLVLPLIGGESETEYRHGESTNGDKAVEWFTVLAEYQHRKQLTRLHNAVSCVMGDFDSIISVPSRGGHYVDPEGATKFGIFTFEKGLAESSDCHVSNKELVEELENLAWMQNAMFEQIQGLSTSRQKDFLARQRQSWDYSKELEESVSIGGPPWLIEARARALFVSPVKPSVEDVDSNKTGSQQLHSELEEGTMPTEGDIEKLKESHDDTEASTIEISRRDHARISPLDHHESTTVVPTVSTAYETMLPYGEDIAWRSASTQGIKNVSLPDVSEIHKQRFAARVRDSEGDIFQSTSEFEVQPQYLRTPDSTSDSSHETGGDTKLTPRIAFAPSTVAAPSGPREDLNHSNEQVAKGSTSLFESEIDDGSSVEFGGDSPSKTDSSHALNAHHETNDEIRNETTNNTTDTRSQRKQRGAVGAMASKPPAVSTGMVDHDLSSASAHSRMDRLEMVMEQLVILNAAQLQRQVVQVPAETNSLASSSMHDIADTLKLELAEIREKMEQRSKEDDLLRNEISLLRDQLAGRRNTPDKTRDSVSSKGRKFPMPEISLKTMVPRRLSAGQQVDSTRPLRRSSAGQEVDSVRRQSGSNSNASTPTK